jgi:hypothetical protein
VYDTRVQKEPPEEVGVFSTEINKILRKDVSVFILSDATG